MNKLYLNCLICIHTHTHKKKTICCFNLDFMPDYFFAESSFQATPLTCPGFCKLDFPHLFPVFM